MRSLYLALAIWGGGRLVTKYDLVFYYLSQRSFMENKVKLSINSISIRLIRFQYLCL